MEVIALVITHNRLDSLQRCITALEAQHSAPGRVLVVDNGSSGETGRWLERVVDSSPLSITVLPLPTNVGGAGGYERGLRLLGHENVDDMVWLLDDDAYPEPTALQILLQHVVPGDRILASAVLDPDTHRPDLVNRRRVVGTREVPITEQEYQRESICIDSGGFVGLLFPLRLVKSVGVPIRQFFLWFDDTEYCLRCRSKGIPILLVPGSQILHDGSRVKLSRSRWDDRWRRGIRNQGVTYGLHFPKYKFAIWLIRRLVRGPFDAIFLFAGPPGPVARSVQYVCALASATWHLAYWRRALDEASSLETVADDNGDGS